MQENKWYPVKVWVTTIVISALFSTIFSYAKVDEPFTHFIPFFIFSVLYGLLYSFPVFGLCFFLFRILIIRHLSETSIKLLLCLVGIAGIIITMLILMPWFGYRGPIIYSIATFISVLLFRIFKDRTV